MSDAELNKVVQKIITAVPELKRREFHYYGYGTLTTTLDWDKVALQARAYDSGTILIDRIAPISPVAFIEICKVLRRHGRTWITRNS